MFQVGLPGINPSLLATVLNSKPSRRSLLPTSVPATPPHRGQQGGVLSVTEAWLAACARNGAGRLASFTRICLWVLRTARVVSCHPCSRCPQVAQLWKRARGNVTLKTDFASSASNARSLSAKSAHALVSGARVAYRRDQRMPVNRLDVLCFWKSEK